MNRHFPVCLLLAAALLLCAAQACAQPYCDGVYRGSYCEGGIEQIGVDFELQDGVFTALSYRSVRYKDGDYMIPDAGDAQKAILRQYRQMAGYLIGRDVGAIDDLYMPYDIVEDIDAVTTATIQSSKLISALWDGLNRRPFALAASGELPDPPVCEDGEYRGVYMEGGEEQVVVEFTVRSGCFERVSLTALRYDGVDYLAQTGGQTLAGQYLVLADYLTGRPLSALNDLYFPGDIAPDTDVSSGATLLSPKVISAIWDGVNRRPVRPL